ncbi:MAG: SEC-C domain-containing protein [Deltaproteobacteria bacterium]|nr:MAG: SEC-C domain-containing protein [Deltaproteobacteria bacterium]
MSRGGLPQTPMTKASVPPPSNETVTNDGPKVGRNDLCHCGSGKKFKKCHGT